MRRWSRELEDSVRWVREEFRRVCSAGGWEGEVDVCEERGLGGRGGRREGGCGGVVSY